MSQTSPAEVVDLFAGAGGWDVAAADLGIETVGIDTDDAACRTAEAAGFQRLRADVAQLDPLDFAFVGGLIGSPPCQAYSIAGKRAGERDRDAVVRCAQDLAVGLDTRQRWRAECEDGRSLLVVEPLRWALALRPTWIALEQVPPVLGLWQLFGRLLKRVGYSTWAGILEAERYGVPQTRKRAILMAARGRPVVPPAPTHQRYVPGVPQSHAHTFDGEVLPWVSMAEALRPRGAFYRNGTQANAAEQSVCEPAPTVMFGHSSNEVCWLDRRQGGAPPRSIDEPSHTLGAQALAKGRDTWRLRGVQAKGGDRLARCERGPRQMENAVRVTVQEAAALQTFPPGYPWRGARTKQHEQVGNAIPPMLARAILGALVQGRVVA